MFLKTVWFLLVIWFSGLKISAQEDVYSICELEDIQCIRDHFASNSHCDPRVFGKMPPSITAPDIRFQAPFFNMSHNDQWATAKNLDKCVVKAFIRNAPKRATIFGIECTNVRIEAQRAFIMHDLGKLDKIYIANVIAEYDQVRLTMTFHGDNLDVCHETAHAWTSLPTIFLKGDNSDSVQYFRNDPRGILGKYLPTWIREVWAKRATLLLEAWIRNVICDFNCRYKIYY